MARLILNIFLLFVLVVLIGSNWLIKPDFTRQNPDWTSDMAVSIPYDSFSVNENFRSERCPPGMTLREPATGTIAFGRIPLRMGTSSEAAQLSGEQLVNQFSATDSSALERGGMVFTNFCFPCHGASARGDGPVTARGFPAPPSIVTGKYLDYRPGRIFHVITNGMNNMPGYAKQILKDDRWKAVLYVQSLQKRAVEEEAARQAAIKLKPGGAGL